MCGCHSFTLRGCYIAYLLYSFEQRSPIGEGRNIVMVDCTLADTTSLMYPFWRRPVWVGRLFVSQSGMNHSGFLARSDMANYVVDGRSVRLALEQ